ncbi:MAG: DUF4412 domain-containing protein [Bacteroidetes bacterium]|nr:DUF4412 domain-containing protein [Bacteroidota bacterium]
MKKLLASICCAFTLLIINAQGVYIEMKISTTGGKEIITGLMKAYSQDGNNRSEMNMNMTGAPEGIGNITMLTLKSNANTVYLLNEKNKTYTEFSSSTETEDMKDYPQSEYEVTVLGIEKVNNYTCKHVRVIRKGNNRETEMWTTTDLIGYADFAKVKTKYTGKANMYKALEAKGAVGFPVRIKAGEQGHVVQIDLVKAEKRNNPAALFSLSGYTKQEGTGLPGGAEMQEMLKQLQNMTPAERDAWMKRLKEQHSHDLH